MFEKPQMKQMNEITFNLLQERAQVPLLSVSKDRECLAVKTWTAKLSSVPKSSWAPLSPLVCLCVHAWPAALLPQTTICCEQLTSAGTTAECSLTASCSQSHYSYRRGRRHMCVHEVCVLPLRGVSPLEEIHHLVVMFMIAHVPSSL